MKLGKSTFIFRDQSGEFTLVKEIQLKKEKLVTRSRIFGPDSVLLEKNIAITQFGHVQNNQRAIRPWASDFTIWFDKKKHTSKSRLDTKNKELDFSIVNPKESKTKTFPFPYKRFFCYFSQIPECLALSGYLKKIIKNKKSVEMVIVWGGYPHINEQYERAPNEPFTIAQLSYDSKEKKNHIIKLSFNGQIIFYHFNKNAEFNKMYWIAQGISIERKK